MHTINKLSVVFMVAVVPTLFCEQLLANDGTPAEIFELMQEGQDVVITLDIVENGEPGLSAEFKLVRSNSERDRTVFSWTQFDKSDAIDNERRCRGTWDAAVCAGDLAADCRDCDDDGVPECPTQDDWCETAYYFEVIDQCVPVGTAEYKLTADGWASTDIKTLNVSYSGEECTVPSDSAGCSIAAVGTFKSSHALVLALVMIAMGMIGYLFARRQPRK